MTKKSFTLLLVLLLQAVFVLEAKQASTKEGVVIAVSSLNHHVDQDRSHVITADIAGHTLTISIHQNVGITHIMIRDANGAVVELENMISSPETTCIYISESGYYRIDIILNNGDLYYGYFNVHDGILI